MLQGLPFNRHEHSGVAKQIGEILIELGALDGDGLRRGLHAQREHGERLGVILTKLGLINEASRAEALSIQLGLPLCGPDDYPKSPVPIPQESNNFLRESKVIPLSDGPNGLVLAMADPLDTFTIEAMELVARKPVLPRVATESDIEAAYERLYRNGRSSFDIIVDGVDAGSTTGGDADIQRLRDMASEAPVIRLVNLMINRALEARASDIHVEPFENRLIVRYRIDGILHEVDPPPARLAAAIVSRIKIMAKLDIAERRLPQDGRVRMRMSDREIDLRIATMPSLHGETTVIRLLEHSPVVLEFPALGFAPDVEKSFLAALTQHHGILLVTGPTGSGKSTTLYTGLNHLNTRERKIITVEDPIEYEMLGVTQIQANPKIDLTFANVLRSMVRQDPDVIMIGEMRDLETAQIAVQSALTGHLVLSTLHTNDAPGAITRLLDMGVDDYLVNSTVNAVLGQRLVRTLCRECRRPYRAPSELVDRLQLRKLAVENEIVLHRAVGCEICGQLGYTGRVGIFEILPVTDELRDLIMKHADIPRMRQSAVDAGMVTMFEDGLRKAVAGQTTIEEVRRVTQEH